MRNLSYAAGQVLAVLALLAGTATAAERTPGLDQTGKPAIKSAGQLAFGPAGVLFVGDAAGAAVFAIGIEKPQADAAVKPINLDDLTAKIAEEVGVAASDVLLNDVAAQPGSGIVYLSAARGRDPNAEPIIATVNSAGKLSVLDLTNVDFAKVELANAPSADAVDRRGAKLRLESITDLQFVDGRLFVAGLSNEEFASKLRALNFPFTAADAGAGVEIYHGAHGAFETRAPIRTFVPFNVGGEPHLLAAYTCTPLVTFPISELKSGSKLRGTTVAELGNRNRPLDIVAYEKDGGKYLLLANSARGVMKIRTDNIGQQTGITERVDGTAGLQYETISGLTGVEHLDKLDDTHAVLLLKDEKGSYKLTTIPLP